MVNLGLLIYQALHIGIWRFSLPFVLGKNECCEYTDRLINDSAIFWRF